MPVPEAAPPVLSVVLTGRNDDHGADFVQRYLRTIDFNHRELAARGIPHEFVFVEWAPQPNRPLLADVTLQALPAMTDVLKTYLVDARYQEALSQNPRLGYLEYVAKNVGIRRASGALILSTNCDIFFGRRVLEALQSRDLRARTLYRAARHDLKLGAEPSHVTWDMLEDPRNADGRPRALRPPLLQGGTGDFVLLDRESFHDLGGFNEVYRLARLGTDHNLLVKAFSNGLDIVDIGGPVYHLNHRGSYRLSRNLYAGREHEAPWGDKGWRYHGVVYENGETWGLAGAPQREIAPGRWSLDFEWDAVPPLVDLRRIVLPVDRVGRPQPPRYRKHH
jgi:hypothetical protein